MKSIHLDNVEIHVTYLILACFQFTETAVVPLKGNNYLSNKNQMHK